MSWYIGSSVLAKSDGSGNHWQTEHSPGDSVPISGIYRCISCSREITSNAHDPFPPQNHHQHTATQGKIKWKLNVRTNTDGK